LWIAAALFCLNAIGYVNEIGRLARWLSYVLESWRGAVATIAASIASFFGVEIYRTTHEFIAACASLMVLMLAPLVGSHKTLPNEAWLSRWRYIGVLIVVLALFFRTLVYLSAWWSWGLPRSDTWKYETLSSGRAERESENANADIVALEYLLPSGKREYAPARTDVRKCFGGGQFRCTEVALEFHGETSSDLLHLLSDARIKSDILSPWSLSRYVRPPTISGPTVAVQVATSERRELERRQSRAFITPNNRKSEVISPIVIDSCVSGGKLVCRIMEISESEMQARVNSRSRSSKFEFWAYCAAITSSMIAAFAILAMAAKRSMSTLRKVWRAAIAVVVATCLIFAP
jgi:hypothetical protein